MAVKGKSERDIAMSFPSSYMRYNKGVKAIKSFYLPPRDDDISVSLLIGPPGSGKTYSVMQASEDLWKAPPGASATWFDGMDQNDDVLFDDFAGKMSRTPLVDLLQILDPYPLRVQVKGAFTAFTAKRIFITTNYHPSKWYDWVEREPQWFALVRRFTHVFVFKGRDVEPTVLERGTGTESKDWSYAWRKFWGHPTQQIELSPRDCRSTPLRRKPVRKTSTNILNKILKKESIREKREREKASKIMRKYFSKK